MNSFRKSIAFKSIFGIIVLIIVFSLIVSSIAYRIFKNALLEQYAEGAFRAANAAALSVDAQKMEAYKMSGGRGQEYLNVWNHLDRICNATDSTFIYVITPDLDDYAHITFWFSTQSRDYDYTKYEFGYYRETTNDDYRAKYKALYEGNSDGELVIRDEGYIETDPHITAMVALKDKDGNVCGILCVQRQMEELVAARMDYLRRIVLALLLVTGLVIAGQWFYLRNMILRPLSKITAEASRFASENVTAGEKLTDSIRNVDEIGILAGSIDQMEEQVQSYVEDLTRATAERERIGAELSLATRIQAAMLPRDFPAFPEHDEFDIYASMRPAREVGGDFYDFFLIDDDHLCIVMADVAGKGVPAALFMMASRIILVNHAKMGQSPAEILENTNDTIASRNSQEMFVTVWLGILEISTGRLKAANAGHEYPALLDAGGTFELYKDKHGFVIGGMAGIKYQEYELTLKPGAKLFLYTDGVPEATDGENRMFGTERMLATLNRRKAASTEDVLSGMQEAVDAFTAGAEQFDDLTMLCLEYKG